MNYQVELEKNLKLIETEYQINKNFDGKTPRKPKLLLHACCGPCSSYVLEYLNGFFDITIFYYNPNIHPEAEYTRRLEELENFLPDFTKNFENPNINLIKDDYKPEDFYSAIKIRGNPELAKEKEKGERCFRCYEFRLKKAFEYAKENAFDYFCTTLSISPFKDAEKINVIGELLEKTHRENNPTDFCPKWLISDFKKKGGFQRSLEISREYDLYRQQYCGCVYSQG